MTLTFDEELERAIKLNKLENELRKQNVLKVLNEEKEIRSKAERCNMCASWTCNHVKKYNFKILGFSNLLMKYKDN